MRETLRIIDADIANKLKANEAKLGPATCHQGCYGCCELRVDASLAEAIHIVEGMAPAIVDSWDFRQRVMGARIAARKNHSEEAYFNARLKCVLLGDDGRCTAYERRPATCRGYHVWEGGPGVCDARPAQDVTCMRMPIEVLSSFWAAGSMAVGPMVHGHPLMIAASLPEVLDVACLLRDGASIEKALGLLGQPNGRLNSQAYAGWLSADGSTITTPSKLSWKQFFAAVEADQPKVAQCNLRGRQNG
jgi:Fe-S-cluster containining protein